MFKNVRLVVLFDMLLNPSLKMTKSFGNIAGTTASTRITYLLIKLVRFVINWFRDITV